MVHKARLEGSVQSDPDKGRRKVENNLSNQIRTFRIPRYTIRTHQHPRKLPKDDQQRLERLYRLIHSYIFERHLHL